MSKEKEHFQFEATLKNILYFVDDENEQQRMLDILIGYRDKMPDEKYVDFIEKLIYKSKKTYYEKVDVLVKDILNSRNTPTNRKLMKQLVLDLQPTVEAGERSFWDKLIKLFDWS